MEKDLYLKIGRPRNACVLCGAPIAEAGKHPSVLLPPEEAKESAPQPPESGDAAPGPTPRQAEEARDAEEAARSGRKDKEKGKGGAAASPAAEEEGGPLRQDYCPSCWEKARQKNYFSFWIARREPPKPRKIKNRKERNAALLAYFDVLLAKNDPAYAQHLYFLAHLLMKFGVLKWVRSDPPAEEDGRERIIFRNTATDDLVTIEAVPLEDEAVARIKKEIDEYICRLVEGEG